MLEKEATSLLHAEGSGLLPRLLWPMLTVFCFQCYLVRTQSAFASGRRQCGEERRNPVFFKRDQGSHLSSDRAKAHQVTDSSQTSPATKKLISSRWHNSSSSQESQARAANKSIWTRQDKWGDHCKLRRGEACVQRGFWPAPVERPGKREMCPAPQ